MKLLTVLLLVATTAAVQDGNPMTTPKRTLLSDTVLPRCTFFQPTWSNIPPSATLSGCSNAVTNGNPTAVVAFPGAPTAPAPCSLPLTVSSADTILTAATATTCPAFTRTWTATWGNVLPLSPNTQTASYTITPPGSPVISIGTPMPATFTCKGATAFPDAISTAPSATAVDACNRVIGTPTRSSSGYTKTAGTCVASATVTYTVKDCTNTNSATKSVQLQLTASDTPSVTIQVPADLKCVQQTCGADTTISSSTSCASGGNTLTVSQWLSGSTATYDCANTIAGPGRQDPTIFTLTGAATSTSFPITVPSASSSRNNPVGRATYTARTDCASSTAYSSLYVCPCIISTCPFSTYNRTYWAQKPAYRSCVAGSSCGATTANLCGARGSTSPATDLLSLCTTADPVACINKNNVAEYNAQLAAVYLNAYCGNTVSQASTTLTKSSLTSFTACSFLASCGGIASTTLTVEQIYTCSVAYAKGTNPDTAAIATCLGTNILPYLDSTSSSPSTVNQNCVNLLSYKGGC